MLEEPWHHKQPNKFPVRCCDCNTVVRPGQGFIFKSCAGSTTWTGCHNECPYTGEEDDDGSWDGLKRDWGDL